ncbi:MULTISPECIES: porin [Chromobacterium]|uniref:Porin n=1 Tax=Chromobacterium rhizoryzae TaxID=1778675 RepID=A0AAD0RW15_9NEIS|nr:MULTISPECIES: porin [Chromobacterium]AXT48136.1 porin [Chromobacterium rhizoryzae]MDH0343947.1 porin [Chromobacterium haemolyticum]PTU71749.1 porin [Chromobacterium haemolyticum]QOD82094.1 porin [Chromobacterium haemolyticum]
MNKTHIALAIAALMPAAAAMADVTIYGEIRGGYEYNKTYRASTALDSNGKPQGNSQINDWTSRIGFKGNEDLGNGLKAIWQVENRVNIDGSESSGFNTRDSFIGLAGDSWGKFRLGRLSNYANDMMEQVDPGYYSSQSVGGLAYFTRLDDRVNNAVRYDSPNWAGFSFAFLYGTDEARGASTDGSRTNRQTWNLGLSYENSGFFGKYNYQHWGDANKALVSGGRSSNKDWHRFEGGYMANNIYAALGYQQIRGYIDGTAGAYADSKGVLYNKAAFNALTAGSSNLDVSKEVKTRELALTLGYTFGSLTPYFSYVKGYDISVGGSDVNNSGYDQYVLALDYALSKRTEVYTSYGHVKWKGNNVEKENSFGLGLVHRF